ncbi:hypothetical protein C8F04DRAFT_1199142 [Mycena alexandri]|uniref:Uncharacterized protein n=1 Tax=Mycena alexandri TaxID=1745969 RepID=A0AAD6WLA0_9AGAR|nr:hypothetical protein C8F04DRAFT_1199142 [Mycena alexandri]
MRITWATLGGVCAALAAAVAFPYIRRDYRTFLEVGSVRFSVRKARAWQSMTAYPRSDAGYPIYLYAMVPDRDTTSHIIQRQRQSSCVPSIPIDDPKNIPSHDTVRRTKREIAHMHDYHDFTLHLALAAQDGKQGS